MATATFVILCLASVFATSWACTCTDDRTDTQIYCTSDFVFNVTVTGEYEYFTSNNVHLRYFTVDVNYDLSLQPLRHAGTEYVKQFIFTPFESSLCGVTMNIGNVYTIAGDYMVIPEFPGYYFMRTDVCSTILNPDMFYPTPSDCTRIGGHGGY